MSLILSGTNGLSDVDGSAATPAIRGTDANTGIFFPAADTIAFAEGGAEIARFDSSGNLLIGTTTQSTGALLTVNGSIKGTITSGTAVASTSGTSISFTALPSWVKRITIMCRSVSLSGSANPLFQLGTGSTTYTTSGYLGASSFIDVSVVGSAAFTAGFGLNIAGAGNVIHGSIVITNIDSNIWVASGVFARSDANTVTTGGSISLGAALTAVRVTTSNGTDTFDAGSVNILYEG
jgi:hypothetical protein